MTLQTVFGCNAQFYLFCGLTDDDFVLPDTRVVSIEEVVEQHLRASGFSQIAFHHPNDGVREVVDLQSKSEQLSAPGRLNQQDKRKSKLRDGPLGKVRLTPRMNVNSDSLAGEADSSNGDHDRRIERLDDTDLPAYLQAFCRKRSGRRAFVFLDADFLLSGINEVALRSLQTDLRDIARGRHRDLICVFVSTSAGPNSFAASERDTRHFFQSLRDHLFLSSGAPRENVIQIGPPEKDELKNLQRRLRLHERATTNFSALDANLDAFSISARSAAPEHGNLPDIRSMGVRSNLERARRFDWSSPPSNQNALAELASMHGRRDVHDRLKEDIEDALYSLKDAAQTQHDIAPTCGTIRRLSVKTKAQRAIPIDLNYALVGRPGTGKTVIARLMGQAFKQAGLLRSGHFIEAKANDFIAGYTGQSEEKTVALLDSAIGGTIFIDEVQSFDRDNSFHRTAVTSLLTYLENRRGELSIIFATYPEHFEAFLEFDPGLERRVTQRIDLNDYDATVSANIFRSIASASDLQISTELDGRIEDLFDNWIHDPIAKPAFANGGSIRKLVEQMQKPARRDGRMLQLDHVPEVHSPHLKPTVRNSRGEEALDQALAELNDLVGLTELKQRINKTVTVVRASKKRGENIPSSPGHFSFEGNPGTGKTTAARLMGQIFRSLGLLKSGHVVEADRQKLVSKYQGGTAHEVDKLVEDALDGVLFIDEAHNLVTDERDPYGQEAIGTLTNRIENNRDRLCVILAGYTGPMERLFQQDPGWNSRIGQRIRFEDYTAVEMAEIVRNFAESSNRSLSDQLETELPKITEHLITQEGQNFSNGRSARNLVKAMMESLDERYVSAEREIDPRMLIMDDVPFALRVKT